MTDTLPAASREFPERSPQPAVASSLATNEDLHRQIFWFFTIIIALSIEQAATPVMRGFLSPAENPGLRAIEAFRLMVFLLVAVRLLLGAAVHFGELRTGTEPGNYHLDILTGFVHFFVLFAWALALPGENPYPHLILLAVVIGYDLLWLAVCRGRTTSRVRGWAFLNAVTLLLGSLAFLIAFLCKAPRLAEILALVVVTLASVVDLAEITSGRRLIVPTFARWIGADRFTQG